MRWNGEPEPAPLHLDAAGRPLCGAAEPGAFLVEQPVDTTCAACLVAIACLRARQEGAAA